MTGLAGVLTSPRGAVLWRTTRLVASSTRVWVSSPSTIRVAVAAISVSGWRMVVSGGHAQRAIGRSSKPITLRSSGTRSPSTRAAS